MKELTFNVTKPAINKLVRKWLNTEPSAMSQFPAEKMSDRVSLNNSHIHNIHELRIWVIFESLPDLSNIMPDNLHESKKDDKCSFDLSLACFLSKFRFLM
ncbi:hypothetical protein CEXT_168851 [Caerostris extrusa]|uniref:Uncharacterized protein n=1 Tax=Caerostris extrusa TaxID=172846 RepID=A0AAV4XIB4_CAEEX|nr:hypothetical protein CEXT_168851 [Caerostris extrusa]